MSAENDNAPPASGVVTNRKRKFVEVAWVEEGMTVWLPWNREQQSVVRCKVLVAAGDHARIVNEKRGIERWFPLSTLYVEEGDPHSYEIDWSAIWAGR